SSCFTRPMKLVSYDSCTFIQRSVRVVTVRSNFRTAENDVSKLHRHFFSDGPKYLGASKVRTDVYLGQRGLPSIHALNYTRTDLPVEPDQPRCADSGRTRTGCLRPRLPLVHGARLRRSPPRAIASRQKPNDSRGGRIRSGPLDAG